MLGATRSTQNLQLNFLNLWSKSWTSLGLITLFFENIFSMMWHGWLNESKVYLDDVEKHGLTLKKFQDDISALILRRPHSIST
jgi:hypothetical protein